MSEELKPCPFCEQQAEVGRFGNPRLSTIIECTCCGCRVESPDQHPNHARSWNTRPIEDAIRAEVAHYKAALDADRGVIARLQAELANPEPMAPLGLVEEIAKAWESLRHQEGTNFMLSGGVEIDAAIREARGK